ncbi:TRPT1, partial [Symbiodinium natans]
PDGTRRRTRNELAARSARRNAPGNQRERADTAAPRAQEMNQQPWRQATDRESRQPHWQNARGADARPRDQHQDWYYDEEDEDDEDYQFDASDRHEVHATEDEEGYLKIWWQGEWWFRQKPPDPPASPKKRQQASSSSEQRRPTIEGAVPPAPAQHVSEGLKQFVPPARDSVPPQSLRAVREKWNLLAIIEDDINVLRKKKVALMFKTFFEMGHFVKHHDDFHHSESLKIIPAAGNWNLAFAMCLISRDKLHYANHSTFGTAVECWLWSLSKDADFEPILTQFAGMLHSVIALFEGVPMSLHEQIHWFDSHQDLAIKFDYYFPTEQLKDDEQIVRVAIQDQTSQDSRDDDMPDRTSKHRGNTAPATRTAELASSDAYVEMEVDYPTGQTPPNQSGSIPHSPRRVERYNIYTETTYASSDGTSLPMPARDSAPLGEPTKLYWKLDQSLSKRLSVVLRHDSEDFGLTFDEAGWTKVSDLLRTSIMKEKGATLNYIRSVVYWNDKQRFALEWRGADLYIRAVQGHSKKGIRDEAVMRPLGDAELPEHVLHATNWDFYGSILAKGIITGGLSQSRTHIHCVSVDKSEYRNYPAHCDIAIILSPKESGAVWFRSMNGYYLTRGADGKLAPHCIKAVRILASGEEVFGSEGPPAADLVMQAIVRTMIDEMSQTHITEPRWSQVQRLGPKLSKPLLDVAIRNHHNSIGWIAKRSLRRARARAYATGNTLETGGVPHLLVRPLVRRLLRGYRNDLIIAGDFNCSIKTSRGLIGSAVVAKVEGSPDEDDFLGILQAHIRRVAPCRLPNPVKPSMASRQCIQDSIAQADDRAKKLKHLIDADIQKLDPDLHLHSFTRQVDEIMKEHMQTVYPPEPAVDNRVSQNPQFKHTAKEMWAKYREWKSTKANSLIETLRKWKKYTEFRVASKAMKQTAKKIKREKLQAVAEDLQAAAAKGDQRKVWMSARKLVAKTLEPILMRSWGEESLCVIPHVWKDTYLVWLNAQEAYASPLTLRGHSTMYLALPLYHCSVGVHEDHVTTTRGIKQGCTVAPYLFVAHTIAIIDTLAERLGWDWVTQLFTFYADDALAAWTLKSAEDLQGAICGIQKVVQTFNDHGMTLSATKSVVLCHAKGADAIRILQKLKVFKDKLPHLAFMQHGEQILIPLRKTHQYLGTKSGEPGCGAQQRTGYWRWALDPQVRAQLALAINSLHSMNTGYCPVLYPECSTQGAAVGPEADTSTNPKAPEEATANEPPPIAQKPVLDVARQQGWKSLLDADVVSSLKQHCCVCKRWIADPTALKRHIVRAHKDVWAVTANGKLEDYTVNMTTEVVSVFGNLLPGLATNMRETSKQPREMDRETENAPNKRPKAARRGQRGGRRQIADENLNSVVTLLANLSLQQEDALNRLRLDTSFTFHLQQQGPGTILLPLFKAGQEWQQKQKKGENVPPMRIVALGLLLKEVVARVQLMVGDPTAVENAMKHQWLDQQKRFVYQEWNSATKKVEPSATAKSLKVEEATELINQVAELCLPDLVTRFCAQRRPKQEPQEGDKAVFLIEVAMRDPRADILHQKLRQLANCAVWNVVGAQLQPPNQQRHGLAMALQKALENI